jgi:DNA ligase (NAD+)
MEQRLDSAVCREAHDIHLLKELDREYYAGNPIETDDFYDRLKVKCKKLYPENPYFKTVGAPVPDKTPWKIVKHSIPMGSIDNIPVPEGSDYVETVLANTKKWWQKHGEPEVLLQHKMDGLSVNIEYQDGKAVHAILRNDGIEGEDVLRNLSKGLPKFAPHVDMKKIKNVRCEILLWKYDFIRINENQKELQEKPYANCRNAAAGIARRFDGKYSGYLRAWPFDIVVDSNIIMDTERLSLLDMGTAGGVCGDSWDIIEMYYRETLKARNEIPYAVDGVVIKINDLTERTDNSITPDWIRAMKFPPEAKSFRVDKLDWFVGKIGHVTPVIVNIRGVQFQDKVVKNVTLHNYEQFCKHQLAPGDNISVVIAGDVIPKIEEVLKRSGEPLFTAPKSCPECNSILRVEEKFLVCDSEGCPGRVQAMINAFIKEMGIDNVGEETVEKLLELGKQGIIKFDHYPDLYSLTIPDMLKVEGYAYDSAKKAVDNIQAKKVVALPKFIAALGIPWVGSKVIEKLEVTSLEELMEMSEKDMTAKEGIGELTAQAIKQGIIRYTGLIGMLLGAGVRISQPKILAQQSDILKGESFCFTGDTNVVNPLTMKKFDRDELWDLVKQHGGIVKTGVSKKLNNLVLVDLSSQTSKARKARELQINIMTDIHFLTKIGVIK